MLLTVVAEGSKGTQLTRRVIMIEPALRIAPANVRQEASRRFEEIARALEDIPSGSVFWASARVSQLRMVVHGWSFFYTLDDEALRVTEVRPA